MAIRKVEETNLGVYVWVMADGRWAGDDQGNYMNIASEKGNLRNMALLADAAKYYGVFEDGQPLFLSGKRQISDEEYERQKERAKEGELPDEYDFAALKEQYLHNKEGES